MSLLFENESDETFDFDPEAVARKVVDAALETEGFPCGAEVSVTLTDGERVHELNLEYRNVDAETDVLSFPLTDLDYKTGFEGYDFSDDMDPDTGEVALGDIVLSAGRIRSQAEEYGHSILREYAFLICHSMLHLMGYDHIEEEDRVVMEEEQRKIMEAVDISR